MSNLMQYGNQKIYPQLEREMKHLMDVNKDCIPTISIEDIPITTPFTSTATYGAYTKHIYIPSQNIIYFIPRGQLGILKWHYFNVTTNTMMEYTHGLSAQAGSNYYGGIYDYNFNRIILIPVMDLNKTTYIDISSIPPKAISYTPATSLSSYPIGGIADFFNKSIYMAGIGTNAKFFKILTDYTINYETISITSTDTSITSSNLYTPSTLRNYIIREDGTLNYLDPQLTLVYFHKLNSTTMFSNTIYTSPSKTSVDYAGGGSNQVYIPFLRRSYYGNGKKYLDFNLYETRTIIQNNTNNDRILAMNGLNNKIYFLRSNGYIDVLDITTNEISTLNTTVTLGTVNPMSASYNMTTDGKIIIFQTNSSSSITTSIKKMTINLNLKVKPSVDLLLSGLINN